MGGEDVDCSVYSVEVSGTFDFVMLGPWNDGTMGQWGRLGDGDAPGGFNGGVFIGGEVIEIAMGPGDS